MTDYYTEYCFVIQCESTEELVWLMDWIEKNEDDGLSIGECMPDIKSKTVFVEGDHLFVEDLVQVLQPYLAKWNRPPIGFQAACTASKPRLDAYGGGAVWIAADHWDEFWTNEWLTKKIGEQDGQEDIWEKLPDLVSE